MCALSTRSKLNIHSLLPNASLMLLYENDDAYVDLNMLAFSSCYVWDQILYECYAFYIKSWLLRIAVISTWDVKAIFSAKSHVNSLIIMIFHAIIIIIWFVIYIFHCLWWNSINFVVWKCGSDYMGDLQAHSSPYQLCCLSGAYLLLQRLCLRGPFCLVKTTDSAALG